jgi:4-hydroxy-tetrahydrodipicolinate reductase
VPTEPIRVVVAGPTGRVGRLLVEDIDASDTFVLAGTLGRGTGELPACDVLIDFTSQAGFQRCLDVARAAKVALVSGTTGLSGEDEAAMREAGGEIPLLHATNTSLGVALLNKLAADAARVLGEGFDVDIVETHHRHKQDAPSGTAWTLADHVLAARGQTRDALDLFRPEHGRRQAGRVGMHSLRMGDVVGEHTVHLAGVGERIALTHAATDRRTFSRGALRAAAWLVTQPPGVYGMADVLREELA